jgi:CubicO group peptidase (beta-lactamase class C family)
MRTLRLLLAGALLASTSIHLAAQARPNATNPPAVFTDPDRRTKLASAFADIDTLFNEFTQRSRVPGAAWGIVIDGELAHFGATGYRDLSTKTPVDRDSVFRIASMTKSFTAMAILKLRDQGKLALDEPAEKYVPELKSLAYPTADAPRITIRHLLTHSEGFPEDNPWGDQQLAVSDDEMSRMMKQGIPFSNVPGIAYEYSNYGFAILGRIVTNASGRPYRDYIRDNILRPLGMTNTTLEPREVAQDKFAFGYRWEDETWKLEPALPDGAFGAMGGMVTTVSDLSKYVGAFLAAWPPRDGAEAGPVSRASLREMQQVWRMAPASAGRNAAGVLQLNAGGYGYGLRVSQSCAFTNVSHSGGLPGYGSLMRWLPEHGVGIIAFGNLTYTGWNGPVNSALDLLAKTGGLQARAQQPSAALVSMRDRVSRLITTWDDRVADEIAAVNLYLDQSKDRRRAHIAQLREKVGQCTPPTSFDYVENALRGVWTLPCERGMLRVNITLAPTMPPKVQHLQVSEASERFQPRPACSN